jgi:hypothetical protein
MMDVLSVKWTELNVESPKQLNALCAFKRVAHHHRPMAELLGPTILAAPECQIILVSIMSKTFYQLPQHPNVQ